MESELQKTTSSSFQNPSPTTPTTPTTSTITPHPIPTPTYPKSSSQSFTILTTTLINAPVSTVFNFSTYTSTFPQWNTFTRKVDILSNPNASLGDVASIGSKQTILKEGATATFHNCMKGRGYPVDNWSDHVVVYVGDFAELIPDDDDDDDDEGEGKEKEREKERAKGKLQRKRGGGGEKKAGKEADCIEGTEGKRRWRRGKRIVWRTTGYSDWMLRAERVQEFVSVDGHEDFTEYRTWGTFGGVFVWIMTWAGIREQVRERFREWADDLKGFTEIVNGERG